MTQDQFVIDAEGIVKTFKDFWGRPKVSAVRGIDIKVKKGSIYGLLGPNGAGKSTFLKMVLGHLYPTEGSLKVMGEAPKSLAAKEKIGYLPERSYMYKNLTGRETLHYFGEILKLPKKVVKERTEQLLEMVGLADSGDRLVGAYSHGMTRRIGMAQALLNAPELLILDEPTAGLDPVGCREVKDIIIELGKQGKTVLVTSHLLADIQDVCDEIAIMFGGSLEIHGSCKDLLSDLNTTQLNFPKLPEKAFSDIKKSIQGHLGEGKIEESSPVQSLEEYFLKVVAESHARQQETSGAGIGKGVAKFLKK